jgi:hypothetical protein
LLAACGLNNIRPVDIKDGGLLSSENCSAPCFWNIIPGITTEKQALDILSQKLVIKNCDRWERDESGRDKGIRCKNVGITFDNNIVNVVSFKPSIIITVGEVIEKYGVPDGIGIAVLGLEMTPPLSLRLYFDQERMIVYLPEQNKSTYSLLQDTTIITVGYFEQSKYFISKNTTQAWNGYGEYYYNTP